MMVNIFSLAVLIIRLTCFTILRFHKLVKLARAVRQGALDSNFRKILPVYRCQ